ncbi:MAG TPA: YggS family pyridoxal phosphate-dependent enzyme [Bacteroidetes bacterium]|nr:YggS family pyridoxal phosphate-dependent enzyme [Bacteroidota bacterium]
METWDVATRLGDTTARINAACEAAGRDPSAVRLMLATKTQSADTLRSTYALGPTLFGENRVQEFVRKHEELADLSIEWHFIGHLQTNKVRDVLGRVQCIQSVDRPSLVDTLSKEAEQRDLNVDIMIEVNVSSEKSKHGVYPEDLVNLLNHVRQQPRLRVTGFMTIGANVEDHDVVRSGFRLLRELRDDALQRGLVTEAATELSMGMSGDLELAIAEGSTIVRVGTAIFGER